MDDIKFGGGSIIMTAFENYMKSDSFRNPAKGTDKEGGRLRMIRCRFKNGTLSPSSMIDMLLQNGYKVAIKYPQ